MVHRYTWSDKSSISQLYIRTRTYRYVDKKQYDGGTSTSFHARVFLLFTSHIQPVDVDGQRRLMSFPNNINYSVVRTQSRRICNNNFVSLPHVPINALRRCNIYCMRPSAYYVQNEPPIASRLAESLHTPAPIAQRATHVLR